LRFPDLAGRLARVGRLARAGFFPASGFRRAGEGFFRAVLRARELLLRDFPAGLARFFEPISLRSSFLSIASKSKPARRPGQEKSGCPEGRLVYEHAAAALPVLRAALAAVDVPLLGVALPHPVLLLGAPKRLAYPRRLREYILEDLERHAHSDTRPVKPQRILRDLREALGPRDLVISDVGAHKLWVARMFLTSEPNTVIPSNGFAAMGIALPGAIAAKLIEPERPVVAVCGDGGFGLIQAKQVAKFGRAFGVSFGNPDFVAFAESFGARGYRGESAAGFRKILQEALAQKVPSVIDVPIDDGEHIRLTEELGHSICPV